MPFIVTCCPAHEKVTKGSRKAIKARAKLTVGRRRGDRDMETSLRAELRSWRKESAMLPFFRETRGIVAERFTGSGKCKRGSPGRSASPFWSAGLRRVFKLQLRRQGSKLGLDGLRGDRAVGLAGAAAFDAGVLTAGEGSAQGGEGSQVAAGAPDGRGAHGHFGVVREGDRRTGDRP